MLKALHHFMISNALTGPAQRLIVDSIKSTLGIPDAYSELCKIALSVPESIILDIGSHHGLTVEKFLLKTNDRLIHGFEPTPASFEKLKSRFELVSRVALHNLALSEDDGEMEFFCNSNEQTNSLLDNDGNQKSFADQTAHNEKIRVRTMTLDNWAVDQGIESPLIIKADIQGAEGLLIKGGKLVFSNQVIAFYSEIQLVPMYEGQLSFEEINSLLVESGFVLRNIYPCMHDHTGQAVQTDVLWIKPEFLSKLNA